MRRPAAAAAPLILPTFAWWVQTPGSIIVWALLAVGAVGLTLAATACALPLVRRVAVGHSAA